MLGNVNIKERQDKSSGEREKKRIIEAGCGESGDCDEMEDAELSFKRGRTWSRRKKPEWACNYLPGVKGGAENKQTEI